MRAVVVDDASPVPSFEQVRSQVAAMIRSGELSPGEHLPPVRQLAADLGLAKNTVAKAYAALESEGLVVGDRRRGTLVLAASASPETDRVRRVEMAERAAVRYLAEVGHLGFPAVDAIDVVRRVASAD
ncbi:MAG: GntR family transcriptional regulator [Acidimicrobiales bacterium]|nr:GntR family transcriptional regulator [Acidimicrobiales bacterium]